MGIEKVVTGFLQKFRVTHVVDVAMLIQMVSSDFDFCDNVHV
jgi:hypothetical protein